uniref:Uncharacterized protein n=1 Tax=Loigolactobacillus rennini TaxID=238013 RepID=A0A1K2I8V6_9LACO|nr:hypothetical protein LREN565_1902 [Loigolactobacillus rennini]
MTQHDQKNSRVARHAKQRAQRAPKRTTAKQPISKASQTQQPFIIRHRWGLIFIVILIVAFGIYAEFSSIAKDNQTTEPQTTQTTNHHQDTQQAASSSHSSTSDTSSSSDTSSDTTDSNSDADTDEADKESTDSENDGKTDSAGDGQTFSSVSEAVSWGRAHASTWLNQGYHNFNVVSDGHGGYQLQYVK